MAAELESDLWDIKDWDRKWLADFNAGKTQLVLLDWSSDTDVIDVKMDEYVLEENSFLRCWGFLSLLNQIGAFTLSLLPKTGVSDLWSLFLLSLLCIFINLVYSLTWNNWAGAPSYYLELLDKLQKHMQDSWSFICWIFWTLGSLSK